MKKNKTPSIPEFEDFRLAVNEAVLNSPKIQQSLTELNKKDLLDEFCNYKLTLIIKNLVRNYVVKNISREAPKTILKDSP